MTTPTLGFLKIIVDDMARAERFYEQAFDLRRTGTFENRGIEEVILRGERGASLVLFRWKDGRALTLGDRHGPIGFHVDDVEVAYARAIEAGATSLRAPALYGSIHAAFVADADGHEIELVAR